jgi:chromosome segregation ATPase
MGLFDKAKDVFSSATEELKDLDQKEQKTQQETEDAADHLESALHHISEAEGAMERDLHTDDDLRKLVAEHLAKAELHFERAERDLKNEEQVLQSEINEVQDVEGKVGDLEEVDSRIEEVAGRKEDLSRDDIERAKRNVSI